MNILIVYPWDINSVILQNNGAGRRVGLLAMLLRDAGYTVEVISFGYTSLSQTLDGIHYRQKRAPSIFFLIPYWGTSFLLGKWSINPLKLWLLFLFYERSKCIKETLQKYASQVDCIFLEYPFAYYCLQNFSDKIILTNHDIQTISWWDGWNGRFRRLKKQLFDKELNAMKRCKYTVLVSSADQQFFKKHLKKELLTIENPLVLPRNISSANQRRKHGCLFVGSGWFPNRNAAIFINNEIAPQCPDKRFTIVGSCCDAIKEPATNVLLLGIVTDKALEKLYTEQSMVILPLFQGTGMSLKTLEALGRNLAVISTKVGVRGLPFVSGKHGIIAESTQEFVAGINTLQNDSELLQEFCQNGYELVRRYDYKNIFKPYLKILSSFNR